MMKMLIKLDEERVKSDGKYDLADTWRVIDGQFTAFQCDKEKQADGSFLYSGNANRDVFGDFFQIYAFLSREKWFAEYCAQWIMYSNEDDEDLPLSDENLLEKLRKNNPLFAHAY